jgi:hypothetical protein
MAFGSASSGLNSFISEITNSVRNKNGQVITNLIQIDLDSLPPQRQQSYLSIHNELKRDFPASNDQGLVTKCKEAVSQDEFSFFSHSFSECLVQYFRYLRDFPSLDNLKKATQIRQLTR